MLKPSQCKKRSKKLLLRKSRRLTTAQCSRKMRTVHRLAISTRTVISALIVEMIAVDAGEEREAVDTVRTVVAVAMTAVAIVRIAIEAIEIEELVATRLTASTSRTAILSILTLWARRSHHSNSKFIFSSRARKVAEMTSKKAREAHQRFVT